MLQKLRGSIIPGYVSLFERSDGGGGGDSGRGGSRSGFDSRREKTFEKKIKSYRRSKSAESLDRLLDGIEEMEMRSKERRGING